MGETDDDESQNDDNGNANQDGDKETNRMKEIIKEMKIKNIQTNVKTYKQPMDTVSEMETMMSTYTDNDNDALFSFKSTFQTDLNSKTLHRQQTVQTDNTFPSLPVYSLNDDEEGTVMHHKRSSCDSHNTMQQPVPKSHNASTASKDATPSYQNKN